MNPIDIVIPYRFSPVTKNTELRYSLRSIEKHLTDVGQVYLIGDKPDYIQNVVHMPMKETEWYKQLTRNIFMKLLGACITSAISDPFLYTNDDIFLLEDVSVYDIPFYHKGRDWTGRGKYLDTLQNTLRIYPEAFNFDTHAPMLIHKHNFIDAFNKVPWETPFGFAIKTCYCMHQGIKGEYYPDYKLNRAPVDLDFEVILTRKFFSVDDKAMTDKMLFFLETLFPYKSKYEI